MKNDIASKRDMYDILRAPDRLRNEVRGVGGLLAYLWRTILMERNIGLTGFDLATAEYIRKARRLQTSSRVANYFSKSNIFREMSKTAMTWKVLIKGLQLIGIREFELTIKLKGRYVDSSHSLTVNLSGDVMYEQDDEDTANVKVSQTPPEPPTVESRSNSTGGD